MGKNDHHIKIYLPCNSGELKREITPKWVMGFTSKFRVGRS
jgi:hypothetical protein